LQTVASSQYLMEAFLQKYNPVKLLDEILKSLSIDPKKLEVNDQERAVNQEMIQRLRMTGTQNQGMSGVPQATSGERQSESTPIDRSSLSSFVNQNQ